jgi:hypothetical protein
MGRSEHERAATVRRDDTLRGAAGRRNAPCRLRDQSGERGESVPMPVLAASPLSPDPGADIVTLAAPVSSQVPGPCKQMRPPLIRRWPDCSRRRGVHSSLAYPRTVDKPIALRSSTGASSTLELFHGSGPATCQTVTSASMSFCPRARATEIR